MNSPRTGLRAASVIFGILAVAHIVRLINQTQVTLGSYTIPIGLSWIALIVAAILCIWMWRLSNLVKVAGNVSPTVGPHGPGGPPAPGG